MTRMVRQVLHGPLPERWNQLPDAANLWRRLPYLLLLAGLLVFGCWPKLLTDKIAHDMQPLIPVAGNTVSVVEHKFVAAPGDGRAPLAIAEFTLNTPD